MAGPNHIGFQWLLRILYEFIQARDTAIEAETCQVEVLCPALLPGPEGAHQLRDLLTQMFAKHMYARLLGPHSVDPIGEIIIDGEGGRAWVRFKTSAAALFALELSNTLEHNGQSVTIQRPAASEVTRLREIAVRGAALAAKDAFNRAYEQMTRLLSGGRPRVLDLGESSRAAELRGGPIPTQAPPALSLDVLKHDDTDRKRKRGGKERARKEMAERERAGKQADPVIDLTNEGGEGGPSAGAGEAGPSGKADVWSHARALEGMVEDLNEDQNIQRAANNTLREKLQKELMEKQALEQAKQELVQAKEVLEHEKSELEDMFACCVCRMPLTTNVWRLGCGHVIHGHCLQQVLNNQYNECPVCRTVIDGDDLLQIFWG